MSLEATLIEAPANAHAPLRELFASVPMEQHERMGQLITGLAVEGVPWLKIIGFLIRNLPAILALLSGVLTIPAIIKMLIDAAVTFA